MKRLLLSFLLAASCYGQTAIGVGQGSCPSSTGGQIIVAVPLGSIAGIPIIRWTCAAIDPATLTLDTTTNPPTLRAKPQGTSIVFVDQETPTGTVDGINGAFSLAVLPNPVSSLLVYRNGIRQKLTFDFQFAGGPTFTFMTGSIPQPGDTLLVSYRH